MLVLFVITLSGVFCDVLVCVITDLFDWYVISVGLLYFFVFVIVVR